MAPAQEGFCSDHSIVAQIHDRLEQQSELMLFQCHVQICLQTDEVRGLTGHAGRVGDDLRGLLPLGDGQGDICLADHIFGPLLAGCRTGEADRGGNDESMAAQLEWSAQGFLESGGEVAGVVNGGDVQNQQRKLVSAPACEHSLELRRDLLEAAGGLHHQLVPRRRPEHVVDEFEPRDIHQDDRNALPPLRTHVPQSPVELIHEVASVRQSRERVMEARVIEGLLQLQALLHLRSQLTVDRP